VDRLTVTALRAKAGDRRALDDLVRDLHPHVWRLCRYLGRPADPDDLTQETFERLLKSLHRFRADGSVRSWALAIARLVCADSTRRAQRERRLDTKLREDGDGGHHHDASWHEIDEVPVGGVVVRGSRRGRRVSDRDDPQQGGASEVGSARRRRRRLRREPREFSGTIGGLATTWTVTDPPINWEIHSMRGFTFVALAAVLVVGITACGGDDEIAVEGVWARTSPKMATNGAAYMQITSPIDDALVGASASSDVAKMVQVHEVVMDDDGAMMMQETPEVELPAGETVSLQPGGYHIMFMELTEPFEVGRTFDLTLEFESGETLTIEVEVTEEDPNG
jgi:RNA polymerase sigma factor (sigma-70 family)